MEIEINEDFDNAYDLMLDKSKQVIFITGYAGTGKSTLLNYFIEKNPKKAVVLAPTGIAAYNVKGETIHSFFRLPRTILSYEDRCILSEKLTDAKVNLIKNLEYIIIDEISMVRVDIMNAIDYRLRIIMNSKIPFGGKKIIMFGDLFQLPPILKKDFKYDVNPNIIDEKKLLFLHAEVFVKKENEDPKVKIHSCMLSKIYRQHDLEFIEALNNIRKGKNTKKTYETLNKRANLDDTDLSNHIKLCPTNVLVETINTNEFNKLNEEPKYFYGEKWGILENELPVQEELILKVGAKIMTVRNNKDNGYNNGTLAKIVRFEEDAIVATRMDNGKTIYIIQETWENIVYKFEDNEVKKETIGTYRHYPVKLAWAMTIHKSQGLTFDNVYLELGRGMFSTGQLYTALSRCRNFEGLVLSRNIYPTDNLVARFN